MTDAIFEDYVPPTHLGPLSSHECTTIWPLQVSLDSCRLLCASSLCNPDIRPVITFF